jgi:hypothetical protein
MPFVRPTPIHNGKCSFCLSVVSKDVPPSSGDWMRVNCPCCGDYRLHGTAHDVLGHWALSEQQWTAIAFNVRRMTDRAQTPMISRELVLQLRETARLPSPDRMLDELILWLGSHSPGPGTATKIEYAKYKAILGCVDVAAHNFLVEWIGESSYFRPVVPGGNIPAGAQRPALDCRLSPDGWQRYRELTTARASSSHGFMAMKYNDPEMDAVFEKHFSIASEQAGFKLRRLDREQAAGLIDDQLRVAIRTAKFLVCDLTHGNRGAYWEAGFAEGPRAAGDLYVPSRRLF